ncbi:MAG: AIR synthase-related protein [Candidatus Marinimicrobia bacterium]|nr:AIR synthase-related protein [Candidatus Neomarinimicrobiota bacterium]
MSKTARSGVNIDLGNQCSRIAYAWAKKSFGNRPAGEGNPERDLDGAFSNIMDFRGIKIGMASDGVGTKIEVAERTGIYDTLGYDLIAMTADDLAANGMETVNLTNILDVDHLDPEIVDALMRGLHDAAKKANIVITGGEIAELGKRICGYGNGMHFNWCAAGIAVLPEGSVPVDGKNIQDGDSIIALKSRGFRSNGFSLLRRIMRKKFGDAWHNEIYEDKTWGELLLTPSLIYSPLIADLRKSGHELKGIAHITGGGLGDNLARALKTAGKGAELYDIFEPLPFMREIQRMGNISEEQAYRLWNMGNGMLIVASPHEAENIVSFAEGSDYTATVCGRVSGETHIVLKTKGEWPRTIRYQCHQ